MTAEAVVLLAIMTAALVLFCTRWIRPALTALLVLTPVAHEATILVMGPGRYRFKDYLRVGGGFAFVTWAVTTWLTPVFYPFR